MRRAKVLHFRVTRCLSHKRRIRIAAGLMAPRSDGLRLTSALGARIRLAPQAECLPMLSVFNKAGVCMCASILVVFAGQLESRSRGGTAMRSAGGIHRRMLCAAADGGVQSESRSRRRDRNAVAAPRLRRMAHAERQFVFVRRAKWEPSESRSRREAAMRSAGGGLVQDVTSNGIQFPNACSHDRHSTSPHQAGHLRTPNTALDIARCQDTAGQPLHAFPRQSRRCFTAADAE